MMHNPVSLFLGKAGAEAIYREGRSFVRVQILATQVTDEHFLAEVEIIHTRGMHNGFGSSWQIMGRREHTSIQEDAWRMPYVSVALYFGDELVTAVVQGCAQLDDGYSSDHFDAITDVLSRFWGQD